MARLFFLAAVVTGRSASFSPAAPVLPQQPNGVPWNSGQELLLREFRPEPRLRVPRTDLQHAKFPVIDLHTHPGLRLASSPEQIRDYLAVMDANQIAISISLDAALGRNDREHRERLHGIAADRFAYFVHLDFRGDAPVDRPELWACNQDGFVHRTVVQLRTAREDGAVGLKFFKSFGLEYRGADGNLLRIDDSRWDPIWQVCGELGLPVLIHTADPSAFFQPIDRHNERYEELSRRPEWSFAGEQFPSRDELLAARNRVIARFPGTTFIAAHLANDGEDLAQLSAWLQAMPNLYVDTASRISELGRQPYSARDFLLKFSDRVLFGTDGPWPAARLQSYWRFFETHDEYFPYSEKEFPPQGFWQIYGVQLPDSALRQIYYENALRLLPRLGEAYAAASASLAKISRGGQPPEP